MLIPNTRTHSGVTCGLVKSRFIHHCTKYFLAASILCSSIFLQYTRISCSANLSGSSWDTWGEQGNTHPVSNVSFHQHYIHKQEPSIANQYLISADPNGLSGVVLAVEAHVIYGVLLLHSVVHGNDLHERKQGTYWERKRRKWYMGTIRQLNLFKSDYIANTAAKERACNTSGCAMSRFVFYS